VELSDTSHTGVTLTKEAMDHVEANSSDWHTWESGLSTSSALTTPRRLPGYVIIFGSLSVSGTCARSAADYADAQQRDPTLIYRRTVESPLWFGSLWDRAAAVLHACDRRLTLALTTEVYVTAVGYPGSHR